MPALASSRIPGLRLDRAGIAFLGGSAMIALGPLEPRRGLSPIDFNTIALLLGMMIVVAHLKVSGAFRALGSLAIEHAHAPFVLLVMVTFLSGVLSAFLVNDAICLVMAPIVLQVSARSGDPLPYLVAAATASNCGSVATITGNPQNMVIGAISDPLSGLRGRACAGRAFGLVAVVVVVRLVFRPANSPGETRSASVARPYAPRAGRQGERRLRRPGDRVLPRRTAGGSRAVRRRVPPLTRSSSRAGSIARSTGRCLSCSPVCSWWSPARKSAADARPHRHGEGSASTCLASFGVHRGALQYRQQRAGGVGAEAVHPPSRSRARLARRRDGSTLAGNFTLIGSVANLIVAEQRAPRDADQLLGLFQGRPALDGVTLAAGTAWLSWT